MKQFTQEEVQELNALLRTKVFDDLPQFRRAITRGGANVAWLQKLAKKWKAPCYPQRFYQLLGVHPTGDA